MNIVFPRIVLILALAMAATACSTYKPQDMRAGQTEADVVALMGQPTGRYSGPGGHDAAGVRHRALRPHHLDGGPRRTGQGHRPGPRC